MDLAGLVKEKVGPESLSKVPEELYTHNQRLFDHLLDQEVVEESDLLKWISEKGEFSFLSEVPDFEPIENFANRVDIEYARKHGFVLGHLEERWTLLTSKPFRIHGIRAAGHLFTEPCQVILLSENQVRSILDLAYRQKVSQMKSSDELDLEDLSSELDVEDNLMNVRDKSPLVKLFYESITHAIDNQASDIHFQPKEEGLVIRERIDGILQDVRVVPRSQLEALLSLIKVMGGMDIAERRKTQDGRATRMYSDKKIDIRISVVPTSYGERAVMRLLVKTAKLLNVETLGLMGENMKTMDAILKNFNNGIVLVTGPTGSGKSTTLCAVLSSLNHDEFNIMTIEDPIEYELKGISQLEVQEKKNVTFATGLRSLVRQDPDIMMVGEIRDGETANMAVQAALTGHLVFSTMHTNDAPGSISRLEDLGVEPFLIASSVVAMMAQRLLRRICPHCTETYTPSDEELRNLGIDRKDVKDGFKRGRGCTECFHRGYRGRIGIYEILIVNDIIREQIVAKINTVLIKKEAVERGDMRTLRMDGADKVLRGITTSAEALRLTQADVY